MDKFLETLLFTMISYTILLVFIGIGYFLLFVVSDIGRASVVVILLLIFVLIFEVIYHLWGGIKKWLENNIDNIN